MPGFLDDPVSQFGMGLLGGTSSNFGVNLAQAAQYAQTMQQQQLKDQQLRQLILSQQLTAEEAQRKRQQSEKDRGILQALPNEGNSTFERAEKIVAHMQKNGASQEAINPYMKLMEQFRPKAKADQQLIKMPDGTLGLLNMLDDGTTQVVPYKPAEEQKAVDLGGVTRMMGKYGGQGSAFENSVSPNAQLGAGVTMRGQNMTDARSREQNAISLQGQQTQVVDTPNGPILVNKRNSTSTPVVDESGAPVAGDAQMKRETGAKNVLSLIKDARSHIGGATNSLVGAGVDVGLQAFGKATEGAQNIAALKTIEGSLLASMPRMEGPQSNYDVQMYKQAAGMLGDPTKPNGLKLAALDAIEKIQQRYAGQGAKAPAGGGFKYLGKE